MYGLKKSMNITKKISFILFILTLYSALQAEKLYLSISYLGLNVVHVTMEDVNQTLKVTAKATPLATIAAKMNNTYISEYTNNFLPVRRIKEINQKDYWENRVIDYDRNSKLATRTSNLTEQNNKTYPIHEETRDFFTALFYIRNHLDKPKELYLDANSLIWSCNYEIVEYESLNTCIGEIQTIKVKVVFKKLSENDKERSDMLTNNLVNEEKAFYIWFSDDEKHLPIKTRYSRKPFPVYWVLESYE